MATELINIRSYTGVRVRQAGGTEWRMSKDSLHVQPSGAKSHVPKARHWAGRDCQPHKHLLNSHCFELVKPMNVTPLNTTDYSASIS